MNDLILETIGLKKRFGKKLAINNISLRVPSGTIYGLLGPNGAGKSTTLKIIAGILRPEEGEVKIFGQPWRREHLENIGILIESPALYGNLTATENLEIHTKIMGLPNEEIDRVLDIVRLQDTGNKVVAKFSTGMKQRLGIAIALLGNPKLLILDEPTNGLDPLGIRELRELIQSFQKRGITVIVSSHMLNEVAHLAQYLGIICDGELKYQGEMDHTKDIEELFMQVVKEDGH